MECSTYRSVALTSSRCPPPQSILLSTSNQLQLTMTSSTTPRKIPPHSIKTSSSQSFLSQPIPEYNPLFHTRTLSSSSSACPSSTAALPFNVSSIYLASPSLAEFQQHQQSSRLQLETVPSPHSSRIIETPFIEKPRSITPTPQHPTPSYNQNENTESLNFLRSRSTLNLSKNHQQPPPKPPGHSSSLSTTGSINIAQLLISTYRPSTT